MGTLVLRLKADKSFLDTSQCTYERNSVEVQKNLDCKMGKYRFYPELAKIWIKKST